MLVNVGIGNVQNVSMNGGMDNIMIEFIIYMCRILIAMLIGYFLGIARSYTTEDRFKDKLQDATAGGTEYSFVWNDVWYRVRRDKIISTKAKKSY